MTSSPSPPTTKLKKEIGLFQVIAICTGVMFSSGFFLLPGLAFEKSGPSVVLAYLLAGILMIIMGFWTGGQFFISKAYTLLVFAGVWAMMKGILDIVRAFQIRKLGKISATL